MINVFSINELAAVAQALRQGEVIAIPTETVYGLAADISQPQAVQKIFELKNRPVNHPLIIHIADKAQLAQYAINIPSYVERLIDAFWPGPLTFVLEKSNAVSDYVTGGQTTVAIRMPQHTTALSLIRQVGTALAAPSANQFGRISPTHYTHVLDEFNGQVKVLNGGACQVGIESTILDVTQQNKCTLLRLGMIEQVDIEKVLGPDICVSTTQKVSKQVSGTLKYHYAPKKPTFLVSHKSLLMQLKEQYRNNLYLLSFSGQWDEQDFLIKKMSQNHIEYAQALYSSLRDADQSTACAIVVEAPERSEKWLGIWDRLSKASAESLEQFCI